MTDSRPDAQSDAVQIINGSPSWELLASEVGYPIRVEMGGKEYEVYALLAHPYDAADLSQAINQNRGGYRRTATTLENIVGDDQAFAALAEKLFIRLEGTSTSDPAAQRAFLDANFKLKVRMAREGLGGVTIDRTVPTEVPVEEVAKMELLPIALDTAADNTVDVRQSLWSPSTGKKIEVRMRHHLRKETEKDWRRWARTASEQFAKAKNQWTEGVNWHERAALYDSMVKQVEGMVTGGLACLESTKGSWLHRVPVWHKLLVIGEVFDEARVKN